MQWALGRRFGLPDHVRDALRGFGEAFGSWQRDRLGVAPELLDAPGYLGCVGLGLLQVILEPFRVVVARRHLDVGLQRGLELLLLRVCLVEELNEFGVAGWCLRHCGLLPGLRSRTEQLPGRGPIHQTSADWGRAYTEGYPAGESHEFVAT